LKIPIHAHVNGLENTELHTRLFRLFFCDALCFAFLDALCFAFLDALCFAFLDALRFAFLDDQRFGLLDHRSLDASSDLGDFVCSWELETERKQPGTFLGRDLHEDRLVANVQAGARDDKLIWYKRRCALLTRGVNRITRALLVVGRPSRVGLEQCSGQTIPPCRGDEHVLKGRDVDLGSYHENVAQLALVKDRPNAHDVVQRQPRQGVCIKKRLFDLKKCSQRCTHHAAAVPCLTHSRGLEGAVRSVPAMRHHVRARALFST